MGYITSLIEVYNYLGATLCNHNLMAGPKHIYRTKNLFHDPIHDFCHCWFCTRRLKVFKVSLLNLFKLEHAQSLQMDNVHTYVNKENKDSPFSKPEIDAALNKMQEDNQIMVSDQAVFLI